MRRLSLALIIAFFSFPLLAQTQINENYFSNIENAEDYIIQSFSKNNIIGLSEGPHSLENSHEFFLKLFSNKKFQRTINVLILEFCSADYQETLDDYIYGKSYNIKKLRTVWQELSQNFSGTWDRPVYFKLLKKIRNVNKHLPKGKKIRVVAGDPGIDWKSINSLNDYFKNLSQRDLLPAHLAIEYGINQNKKVLLIYGGTHFSKLSDETQDSTHWTITSLVNKRFPGSMKVIEILNTGELNFTDEIKNLPMYSAIDLFQNALGNLPAEKIFPDIINMKGEKVELYKGRKVKEVLDAYIYIGPSMFWKISEAPKSAFRDDSYWQELNRRNKIIWGEPLDDNMRN